MLFFRRFMIRERVSENVYVFTSEIYAQVNSGAVVGPEYTVLIDTLAYPDEIRDISWLFQMDAGPLPGFCNPAG